MQWKRPGVYLQMAFQRRFDAGYMAAKKKMDDGVIGTPVVMISTSRDPFRPPLEFCDPKVSGGLIADMGVHDFDLGRMFMGEVATVDAVGGALAYPEMKTVGDIDNALVNMVFENGTLGTVQLSRNSVFGYDIRTEIWGTKGSLQIGYFQHTPILVMTQEGITHDVVPHFMQRFEGAYLTQIQDFVDRVQKGQPPSIGGADAIAAMRISLAATLSCREHRPVRMSEVDTALQATALVRMTETGRSKTTMTSPKVSQIEGDRHRPAVVAAHRCPVDRHRRAGAGEMSVSPRGPDFRLTPCTRWAWSADWPPPHGWRPPRPRPSW